MENDDKKNQNLYTSLHFISLGILLYLIEKIYKQAHENWFNMFWIIAWAQQQQTAHGVERSKLKMLSVKTTVMFNCASIYFVAYSRHHFLFYFFRFLQ